jgi:hypothetical protein
MLRVVRRVVVLSLAALLVSSCDSGGGAVAWRFVVEGEGSQALLERIDVIEARIVEGGCAGTEVLYETELAMGQDGASMGMPPGLLAPGTYGLAGRAHDARCVYFLEGCTEVTLPSASDAIEVPLVAIPASEACTPGDPGAAEITFDVGSRDAPRAISPWIYGINDDRRGGTVLGTNSNRWSTHDWETCASNGGAYFGWLNDFDLAESMERVAGAVSLRLERARARGGVAVLPLSLMDRVAADGLLDGDVRTSADYYLTRFVRSLPRKPGPFAIPPDLTDDVVYQDELVHYVENGPLARCEGCPRDVIWALDVEPDLWRFSFPDLPEGMALTEAELIARSVELADAVSDVDPDAIVMGPWMHGFASLPAFGSGSDPSAPIGFVDRYARAFFAASADPAIGPGRLDAFATGYKSELDGVSGHEAGDEAMIEARMHAARMLWDRSYADGSWVTRDWLGGPLYLIPRLRAAVRAWLPDADIALPRWSFGGGEHISGAIAAADALGVFGREEGVLMASRGYSERPEPFVDAAFAMYLDYDGLGGTFGTHSMPASTTDDERTAIYASTFEMSPERVVMVAIHRGSAPVEVAVRITHRRRLRSVDVFTLTSASATPTRTQTIPLEAHNAFRVTLPPRSVVTLSAR